MPSRENVIRILRTQTLGINFHFRAPSGIRVSVDSSTFQRVADAIESARIVLDFNKSHLDDGASAMYNPQNRQTRWYEPNVSGVMVLDAGDGTFACGGVVHESVHASLDLTFNPGLMALESEAAAYIAEDLYYKNNNLRYVANNTIEGAVMSMSKRIADSISYDGSVDSTFLQYLISTLGDTPAYRNRRNIRYVSDR